jgi:hypothetical protein
MMWEKLGRVAVAALAALGLGLSAQALSRQAPNGRILAARPADKPSDKAVRDRRWVRSLPCGAIIEVVGVSSVPSGPHTWWRPDGTPLHPAPSDPNTPGISVDAGVHKRVRVVVRLARIPDGADHQWSITEARGGAQGPTMKDGKPSPGLSETIAHLPADAGTCTIRFKVAAGPWKTIVTKGKNAGAGGTSDGAAYIFSGAFATAGGTTLLVTHDIRDKSVRLVAVDREGKELPGRIQATLTVKDFQQIEFGFDSPPEQLKEFRLQTRPYDEVEIPRIALKRE